MYLDKLTQPKYDLLTKEEELDAVILAQCGCPESLDLLIKRNVNTVWHFLRKTGHLKRAPDFEEDLFQCGMLGLIKGIMKFDYNSGLRLSTYASNWIKQEIGRAVHCGLTNPSFSVPVHHSRIAGVLYRAEVNGAELTVENCYDEYVKECKRCDISVEYSSNQIVESYKFVQTGTFSGNESYDNGESGDNGCFFDSLAIDQPSPEEILRKEQGRAVVIKLIDEIPVKNKRDLDIIKERFGLIGDPDGSTLEVIGEKHGCTRERVRQIEAKMLKLLRSKMNQEGYESLSDIL